MKHFWFRSLTIGNNPYLSSQILLSIILNCDKLDSLYLYRINNFCEQDMKFLLSNTRLNSRLKELELDRIFQLNSMSYEVIFKYIIYYKDFSFNIAINFKILTKKKLLFKYILECKKLETLRIKYSSDLSIDTIRKIPSTLIYLKSFIIERVCRINSHSLSNIFMNNSWNLHEFGLTGNRSYVYILFFSM